MQKSGGFLGECVVWNVCDWRLEVLHAERNRTKVIRTHLCLEIVQNFTDDKRSLGPSPIPPSLGPSPVPTLASHPTVPAVRYHSIEEYLRAEMEEDYSVCRHVEFSATMCQGYLVKEGGK